MRWVTIQPHAACIFPRVEAFSTRPGPMNAPLVTTLAAAATLAQTHPAAPRLREIPYNYTSFTDR